MIYLNVPFQPTALFLLLFSLPYNVVSDPVPSKDTSPGVANNDIHLNPSELSLIELYKRVDAPSDNPPECEDVVVVLELPTDDGPTADGSAGLGVEFETASIYAKPNEGCTESISSFKRKLFGGRSGDNWKLTADLRRTNRIVDSLAAEYIINGKTVKLGKGLAQPAAREIAADVIAWNPRVGQTVSVEGSSCTWTLFGPAEDALLDELEWQPQITAPLPLEAISDLFTLIKSEDETLLTPRRVRPKMVSIDKNFFQSKPGGMDPDEVSKAVFGFASIVVSYAKSAREMKTMQSPKVLLPIMPRTNFVGLWRQVSSEFGDRRLWDIVQVLACYNNAPKGIRLDFGYCRGSKAAPVIKGTLAAQKFIVPKGDGSSFELSVEAWVNSIQDNPEKDDLTTFDENFSSSIGYLELDTETIYGGTRKIPLFEFRGLDPLMTEDMESFVVGAEKSIISYNQKYSTVERRSVGANAPLPPEASVTDSPIKPPLSGHATTFRIAPSAISLLGFS